MPSAGSIDVYVNVTMLADIDRQRSEARRMLQALQAENTES